MPDLTGKLLAGRYQVREFLGRGGMAEVYRVYDSERMVELALKLLHADLAQDVIFLRRFKREAQTLASLQHPNIVRFYGLEKDGIDAFILMDFIEGTTLRAEIARQEGRPFSPQQTLDILQPVCAALHYAHRQGFVHCDVKPANIMINQNRLVLLADFGIARMTESATTTTMLGAGTPAYMAPEQARGELPTPQSDIYALGIVLYEMLTGGERPFTGEQANITGSTAEKLRWEQLNLVPVSPRRYNPALPAEVEEIVMRCLEKDPARRFASAMDLLTAFQSRLGTGARPAVVTPARPPAAVPPQRAPDPLPSRSPAAVTPQRAAEPRLLYLPSTRPRRPSSVRPKIRPVSRNNKPLYIALAVIILIVLSVGAIAINYNPDLLLSATNARAAATRFPMPALVGTKTYASAPPMLIDTSKQYTATVTMAKGGQFVIQLYADKAPVTVNSFIFLARQGYFDGVTFHRVLQGFIAQGGDPTGTGSGGPGYAFENENSGYKFDKAGVVGMSNAGSSPPTNGSQFFITLSPQQTLNGGYTIFGQVISGMDVVNAIKLRDPNTNPTFLGDAIQTVTIIEK